MRTDLEVALEAAQAGAAVVREALGGELRIDFKSEVDPVTHVDHQAETAIRQLVATHRPADGWLGEESGGDHWAEGRVWICDPIDGTVNFLHGLPQVSVSVALWEKGSPRVGVVIDVARQETFAAAAGEGATLNDRPIEVSTTTDPPRALIVTGFPYDRQTRAATYLPAVEAVLTRYQGLRRLGSAALDMCWVACGRLDGYWEYQVKPWDAAAGMLIIEEAGGVATDTDGRHHSLDRPMVAGNPIIQPDLLATVGHLVPDHLR